MSILNILLSLFLDHTAQFILIFGILSDVGFPIDHAIGFNGSPCYKFSIQDISGQDAHLIMLDQEGYLNNAFDFVLTVEVLVDTSNIKIIWVLDEDMPDVQSVISLIYPTLIGLNVDHVDL